MEIQPGMKAENKRSAFSIRKNFKMALISCPNNQSEPWTAGHADGLHTGSSMWREAVTGNSSMHSGISE
jgi:hypothetical protein